MVGGGGNIYLRLHIPEHLLPGPKGLTEVQVLEVLISSNLFSFLDVVSFLIDGHIMDKFVSKLISKVDCTIPAPPENMSSIQM